MPQTINYIFIKIKYLVVFLLIYNVYFLNWLLW